ncbi:amino acid adenylation domain-containing protein [Bacillus cereus]|uniref:Amino acid adenylation domain-containing protein n=1 Tax=Bacillus cereus TaxID=1396 RepID=A0A9W7Q3B8_BACCE|nr:non-ribosomal peptide synthetase [Bacillus cereus]KAA6459462.1 amino acid adenylation domain-containing protein [Bacillus cereus]KAB2502432.1 amino acid adenylation domain-containing protein [Bacillus cereus]
MCKTSRFRLTHAQKRILNNERLYPNTPINNISGYTQMDGKIDFFILSKALNHFISIHDALRLRFEEIDGEVFQYVIPFESQKISKYFFRDEQELKQHVEVMAKRPFQSIFNNKLYDILLYEVADRKSGFIVKFHHIIADGWSIHLLSKEVKKIYESFLISEEIPSSFISENNSYLKYLEQEDEYFKSKRFIKDEKFWLEKLELLEKRDTKLSFSLLDVDAQRVERVFNKETTNSIRKYIYENNLTTTAFFIGVVQIYQYLGLKRRVPTIGMPVFNRTNKYTKHSFGMFTSTLPIISQLNHFTEVHSFLRSTKKQLMENYRHQKYPYDLILKKYNSKNLNSLSDISVNVYNMDLEVNLSGSEMKNIECFNGAQFYSKHLIFKESKDGFSLNIDYKTKVFDDFQADITYKAIYIIIDQIIKSSPSKSLLLRELELPKSELIGNKEELNTEDVVRAFSIQALHRQEAIAIYDKGTSITYGELLSKIEDLAEMLKAKGITAGSRVAVLMKNSPETIISFLALLKLGAIFIPIDHRFPESRIKYILKDSRTKLILSNIDMEQFIEINNLSIKILNISHQNLKADKNINNFEVECCSTDTAYIIYTSGSTGNPKGVIVSHQGLNNYISWASQKYIKSELDVFAFYSSISFDLTITSIFSPLYAGVSIVIYDDEPNVFTLNKVIEDNMATIVKITPSHLVLLESINLPNQSKMKTLIVGGEQFPQILAEKIWNKFNQTVEIYNEYGPTEAVVGCMIYKFNPLLDKERFAVPIGSPISNMNIHLLDENLMEVLQGQIGEIYIDGSGLSNGYLNLPKITEKSFITRNNEKNVLYKTGDLARFISEDSLEYVGRKDNQVKINGYRIELDEINNSLLKHPNIIDATIIEHRDYKLLCAFIVQNENNLSEEQVINYLSKSIPAYMLPRKVSFVDLIPLTHNGKVDKDQLLRGLSLKQVSEGKQLEGRLSTFSESVLSVLKEVLRVESLTMEDNFFMKGGDSIKAIQVVSKIKDLGYFIEVKDILLHPTILDFVWHIKEIEDKDVQDNIQCKGYLENSPIMTWFFNQKFNNPNYWNQSILLECRENISFQQLKQLYGYFIEKHDSLRLKYDYEAKKMYFSEENFHKDFQEQQTLYMDLSSFSEEKRNEEIRRISKKVKGSLNIEKGEVFKIALLDFGKGLGSYILLTAHHLVIDGVSWRILLEEFENFFGRNAPKAIYKRTSVKTWNEEVASKINTKLVNNEMDNLLMENTVLPFGSQNFPAYEKDVETLFKRLNKELTDMLLRRFNNPFNIVINELLMMAFIKTITEVTKNNNVVIELESHGRNIDYINADITKTVGWFTQLFQGKFYVESDSLTELIKSLKEQIKINYESSFEKSMVYSLKRDLEKVNSPIRFNFLGDFDNTFSTSKFSIINLLKNDERCPSNHVTASLEVNLFILQNQLNIEISFNKKQYQSRDIDNFLNSYLENIELLTRHCIDAKDIEYTPSDFETTSLDEDELLELID